MYPIFCSLYLLCTQGVLAFQGTPGTPTGHWYDGLTQANTINFLVLSALIFTIGVAGVLTRRNIIVIFMSIELILNAANLNFITFARYWEAQGGLSALSGQIFTIFIIVVAAAEAAIGLGIVIALYRNRETVAIDEIDLLKW